MAEEEEFTEEELLDPKRLREVFSELVDFLMKVAEKHEEHVKPPDHVHAVLVDRTGAEIATSLKIGRAPEGVKIEDLDDQFTALVEHASAPPEPWETDVNGEIEIAILFGKIEFFRIRQLLAHLSYHLKEWGLTQERHDSVMQVVEKINDASVRFRPAFASRVHKAVDRSQENLTLWEVLGVVDAGIIDAAPRVTDEDPEHRLADSLAGKDPTAEVNRISIARTGAHFWDHNDWVEPDHSEDS
jgi:hypothetical protein